MEKKSEKDPFIQISLEEGKFKTLGTRKYERRTPYKPDNPKVITAFIPGLIKKVNVKKGKRVKKGTMVLILEAMKMNNEIFAPFDGTIKELNVKEGQRVEKNAVLIVFK